MQPVASREDLYTTLDAYAAQRRGELNQRSLTRGVGLLKTYLLESNVPAEGYLPDSLAMTGWSLRPIDEGLFQVTGIAAEVDGYLDIITPRYLALYTTAPSRLTDPAVRRAVKGAAELDHVWLSSPILDTIWRELILDTHRFATIRYENASIFDLPHRDEHEGEGEDGDERGDNDDDGRDGHEVPVARLEVRQRVGVLRRLLTKDVGLGELTGNLSRIRVPSPDGTGRYEYFHFGKLTNRGQDFRSFAAHLNFLTERFYRRLTEMIEQAVAFGLERQPVSDGANHWTVRGAPVTVLFPEPLPVAAFERFIELTFERGQGPFRLWGNPLRLSGPKVHVYGLDLHLWQQVYLDLSPQRFVIVLPEGTCGNTVHRLAANIQRFLAPGAEVFVGESAYGDLVRKALRSI